MGNMEIKVIEDFEIAVFEREVQKFYDEHIGYNVDCQYRIFALKKPETDINSNECLIHSALMIARRK